MKINCIYGCFILGMNCAFGYLRESFVYNGRVYFMINGAVKWCAVRAKTYLSTPAPFHPHGAQRDPRTSPAQLQLHPTYESKTSREPSPTLVWPPLKSRFTPLVPSIAPKPITDLLFYIIFSILLIFLINIRQIHWLTTYYRVSLCLYTTFNCFSCFYILLRLYSIAAKFLYIPTLLPWHPPASCMNL